MQVYLQEVLDKAKGLLRKCSEIVEGGKKSFSDIEYKKARTYRIIITFQNGASCGSGFFFKKDKFLTCFHVVFGTELRNIRLDQSYVDSPGNDEHEKLQNYILNKVQRIEVEIDGVRHIATLVNFSEGYDTALLHVDTQDRKVAVSKLDFGSNLKHGRQLFFAGFPTHHDYSFDQSPIAVHQGILSAFVNTQVAGDKYDHLQINSINLGGNSGAPLFRKKGRKVVGIINGNMNWGRDDLAGILPNISGVIGQLNVSPVTLRVPLSIAYATTLRTLRDETDLFD